MPSTLSNLLIRLAQQALGADGGCAILLGALTGYAKVREFLALWRTKGISNGSRTPKAGKGLTPATAITSDSTERAR